MLRKIDLLPQGRLSVESDQKVSQARLRKVDQ